MDTTPPVDDVSEKLGRASLEEETDAEDTKLIARSVGFQEATAEAQILEAANEEDPLKGAISSFSELQLSEEILKGVYSMKYNIPSKIQGLAIPAILKRPASNFIGQAQSGTGKTAAFSLSMLASIDETKAWPQAVVLSPTRELCRQTFDVIKNLSRFTKIRPLLVVPDADIPDKIENSILCCTPGKLEGLVKARKVNMKKITMFILDEADEMLGIQGQDNKVLILHSKLQKSCQICLFSATYNDKVTKFANTFVPQPRTSIFIPPEKLTLVKLLQYYVHCEWESNKFNVLDKIFKSFSVGQSIIFVERRKTAAQLKDQMEKAGHEVSVLYGGEMKETERDRVMDSFRSGATRVLITTNVLARGVDVLQVSLVVNYDLPVQHDSPQDPNCETYLHRIGRSARYGASGVAINFVHDATTLNQVKRIEKHFGREIKELKPSDLPKVATFLEEMV